MKDILLLEDAGVFVDATVCDGAATNRAMWKQFFVSGSLTCTRNSFVHLLDEQRSVYIFSDAPQLVKCVRNCLLKEKVLRKNVGRVMWAQYDKRYVEGSKLPRYLLSKLTLSHLYS